MLGQLIKTYIVFLYFNTEANTDMSQYEENKSLMQAYAYLIDYLSQSMLLLTAYEDIPGTHCDIATIHT